MRKTVIGIGNALVDALVRVQNETILSELNLPKGSMQLVDETRFAMVGNTIGHLNVEYATGGSAGNTILALAQLGNTPAFIGKTGNDDYGNIFHDTYRRAGIETHLLQSEAATGVATTFITPDGQRTFATHLGAAAELKADDLQEEWLKPHHYIYIEGYLVQNHDLMERTIELAQRSGLQLCLDLASYNIVAADRDFFSFLLPNVQLVFANEEEAQAFTGHSPEKALGRLSEICETAVVKIGKHGAMARSGGEYAVCAAMDVPQVVDTTAAGDFFAGGFLHAHAQEQSLQQCLQTGSLLAGHVIQVVGTRLSDATWQQLREMIR